MNVCGKWVREVNDEREKIETWRGAVVAASAGLASQVK